ncbi:MAG: accessory gene regulator B family protein [Lachnospiraceae bacterium]|nr:accessory gene regulator B family protein [Lachnospiraceae bacterium]
MKRLADFLTEYVIDKGIIRETDRELYQYGFTIAIEVGLFIVFSLYVSLYLHMVIEGILFYVIFIPLRSYAGGLHFNRFCICFFLSCSTFSIILLTVKYIHISIAFSAALVTILIISVYVLYPVENINREVDHEENEYFKNRLKKFLLLDLLLVVMCAFFGNDKYVWVIAQTLLLVVVTMAIGKYKYMMQ